MFYRTVEGLYVRYSKERYGAAEYHEQEPHAGRRMQLPYKHRVDCLLHFFCREIQCAVRHLKRIPFR
jgi:hypothetical protein